MTYGNYPDLSSVKNVLVIKLRHLGDCLLTTPVFTQLKKVMPHANIDAYIYQEATPILEGNPCISEIITVDLKLKKKNRLAFFFQEIRRFIQIRKKRYDLVINLTEGDRGVIASILSGAKIRVGFQPKGRWQKKSLTHVVKHTPGLKHTVERNLDALRSIGIFPSQDERQLYFHIPEKAKISASLLVGKDPFILIHPTSRWRFKCWSYEKMRLLVESLIKKKISVVITSGPDAQEVAFAMQIAKDLPVRVLAGKTSIKELGALIALSKTLICVDSVSLHLASALKAPVIALFGPTSDITWGPWENPFAKIVTENLPCRPCYQDGCGGSKFADCLDRIPVEKVLNLLD